MWSTVAVMAIVAGADPVRIGMAAFLLSRPRPLRLLVGFFTVGFGVNIAVGAVILFLLRRAGAGAGRVASPAIEIAVGVLALAISMAVASGVPGRLRRNQRAPAAVGGLDTPAGPPGFENLPGFGRLPARVRGLLRGDSLLLAGFLGLCMGFPTAYYLAALAAMLTSGASAGAQLTALVVFNLVGFAAAVIPICGFLTAQEATRLAVDAVHTWMRGHHRLVISAIAGVVGVFFVGMGVAHL